MGSLGVGSVACSRLRSGHRDGTLGRTPSCVHRSKFGWHLSRGC
jgi:hypothetical protein